MTNPTLHQLNPKLAHHPMVRLFSYSQKYRVRLWQASICSVLNKIFDLAPPGLIGVAVDIVIEKENSILGRWGITDVFWQLMLLCFVSIIIW
ncbi:MAG: ABC transporter, partial [Microcoleaceae cyanobacterium]